MFKKGFHATARFSGVEEGFLMLRWAEFVRVGFSVSYWRCLLLLGICCCTSCQYYFAAMLQGFRLKNKRYCWTNEIQDRPEENIFSSISNSHNTKKPMIPGGVSVSLGRPDKDLWFFFLRRVLGGPTLGGPHPWGAPPLGLRPTLANPILANPFLANPFFVCVVVVGFGVGKCSQLFVFACWLCVVCFNVVVCCVVCVFVCVVGVFRAPPPDPHPPDPPPPDRPKFRSFFPLSRHSF